MKSDPHFYKIFKVCPEFFDLFAPRDSDSVYRFYSRVFKEIDRTCDGVFESEDKNAITYIVEFQVRKDPTIYPRIFLEMAAYQLEHPKRRVRGVLIFLSEQGDPKSLPWWTFSQTCENDFRVVYLEEVIRSLPQEHPLAATFTPLLEKRQDVLQQKAAHRLMDIRQADLKTRQKDALEEVFLSWLTQRFENWTRKEIRTMFGFDTPVEETVFYKEVFQEGEIKGKIEGKIEGEIKGEIRAEIRSKTEAIGRIDKEISTYDDLHEKGYMPADVYAQKLTELRSERHQFVLRLAELKQQALGLD